MSLLGPCSSFIKAGDLALLFESNSNITPLYVKSGEQFQNKWGRFEHDDMIGKTWGTRVQSKTAPHGWLLVMRPTPELWTSALSHRTQIIYTMDIANILFNLHIAPGFVVVESGTGSGSLTTSFARSVAPTGRVHTFEVNDKRVQLAREEFARNKLDAIVTVTHQDVYANGYGAALNDKADAVFLDLPEPWRAVGHAYRALKPGGYFCSFSPCVEQVNRTCRLMEELGFEDIVTMECVSKVYEVTEDAMPPSFLDVADVVQPSPVSGKIAYMGDDGKPPKRAARKSRALKRVRPEDVPAAQAAAKSGDSTFTAAGSGRGGAGGGRGGRGGGSKRPAREEAEEGDDDGDDNDNDDEDEGEGGADGEGEGDDEEAGDAAAAACSCGFSGITSEAIASAATASEVDALLKHLVLPKLPPLAEGPVYVRQAPTLRSHTSFLTFASLWLKSVQVAADGSIVRPKT